jgi:hypothetical protein
MPSILSGSKSLNGSIFVPERGIHESMNSSIEFYTIRNIFTEEIYSNEVQGHECSEISNNLLIIEFCQ